MNLVAKILLLTGIKTVGLVSKEVENSKTAHTLILDVVQRHLYYYDVRRFHGARVSVILFTSVANGLPFLLIFSLNSQMSNGILCNSEIHLRD